jgi:hypothetical protein
MSAADPTPAGETSLAAVEQPQATPERPWLGLAPFTEADRDYFYGRDAEVRELTDRVRRAPLTVLYGVSGYGKSSLIGAGVIPMLRSAGHPIVLLRRCYDDLASRLLHVDVIAACASEIPGSARPEAREALTLWEFFHDRSQPWFQRAPAEEDADSVDVAGLTAWPVLILDQFEEIFVKGEDRASDKPKEDALARESARTFLTQLADLVENRPPAALRERLESGSPDERRTVIRRFDFQARPVRVALAVRDDFLARLERWRRAMPSLMEHRVELRLLSGPQAYKAVYEPGTKRPGQPPILPGDVANRIVRAAAGAAQDVPIEEIDAVPPILSLLCERLNDRRLAASRPQTSITAADFSAGEAERILGEFYDDKLRPHPNALRYYLEDKLVSDSGFRENVSLDSALASLRASVPDADARLRQLVDDRVLVIEARGGAIPRVEFTHDTLAKLALDRRRERQEADRLLQERHQAVARKRRAIGWIAGSLAIAGISIGLMMWALVANAQAQQEKARALDLIRFMDTQIEEAFTGVPVQLRERVSDRLDAFYRSQGEPATFDGRHRRMGHHMRRAMVHLAVVKRYQEGTFSEDVKTFYIDVARRDSMNELEEALRLGDILAAEAPDNREIARDRILTQFHMAMVSTQLGDSEAAAQHLNASRAILDELVKAGPFPLVLYLDWMGLPNLDAAMGEHAWNAGDSSTSRTWYEKALELQKALVGRRPNDTGRDAELKQIKERLQQPVPQQ